MSRKKKIIIGTLSLLGLYYLIGFPLTLSGVVNQWPLFPGGVTLQYAGNQKSEYENEITSPDHDGPYILYHSDSIYVSNIIALNSIKIPTTQIYHISERANILAECTFVSHPEWNFKTPLKEIAQHEPTYYSDVKKIAALSDIEGNFERFRQLLINGNVMDSAYNWTFGDGHLLIAGDVFDRGLNVTECLWLIYNLEAKATQAGGYVHFILGNHEIMNMGNDFRYVRKKYIENVALTLRRYEQFYKPDTELGKWLATKNIAERINDIVFVHGGISKAVTDQNIPLEKMNSLARSFYFHKREDRAANDTVRLLYNTQESPFWNRDYVNQTATEELVNRVLQANQSKVIVVGHTLVESIRSFYDGKVIAIDTEHAGEHSQMLVIENGQYTAIDQNGVRTEIH